MAWFAGGLSGLFGGLVGNQGGIRYAALLGFELRKEAFVATATGIAMVVDCVRMPVYVATEGGLVRAWPLLVTAIAGVLVGTFGGVKLLRRIPEKVFRKILSLPILAVGIYMVAHGIGAENRTLPASLR